MLCPMITIYGTNCPTIVIYWTNCPMITIYWSDCPMIMIQMAISNESIKYNNLFRDLNAKEEKSDEEKRAFSCHSC